MLLSAFNVSWGCIKRVFVKKGWMDGRTVYTGEFGDPDGFVAVVVPVVVLQNIHELVIRPLEEGDITYEVLVDDIHANRVDVNGRKVPGRDDSLFEWG